MNKNAIVRIGNAQGFWGDRLGAAARLVTQQSNLDFLTMDYLSEVSMSILAIQREKNPQRGYALDFVEEIRSLIPYWDRQGRCKLIANAGGLNPLGCAHAVLEILKKADLHHLRVGVVSGDDVISIVKQEKNFNNLDTGESIEEIQNSLVSANVYLGAKPIVEALEQGADIVITGRVADPSLTVACCVFHYGWKWDQYDRLAGATIAGHLIECGTQVSGVFPQTGLIFLIPLTWGIRLWKWIKMGHLSSQNLIIQGGYY